MRTSQEIDYDNALFEHDPETDDMAHLAGLKLATMSVKEEHEWLTDSFGNQADHRLATIMGCVRAALVDETTKFDAEVGRLVIDSLVLYMQSTIETDHEHECMNRGSAADMEREHAADLAYVEYKENRAGMFA